jgi:hypothetical protein
LSLTLSSPIVFSIKVAVWIDMAGKQESIELGEVRIRDITNQDEAALARLGKKSVLKVCTNPPHPTDEQLPTDNVVSTEKVWLSFYPRV